jgi:hypothetical protein
MLTFPMVCVPILRLKANSSQFRLVIIPPDRECNKSEVTINSYSSDAANSGDTLIDYDNMVLGITPVMIIAYGGMNVSKVPMPSWDTSEYAMEEMRCTRAKDIVGGSRVPESEEEQGEDEGEETDEQGEEPDAAIASIGIPSMFFVGASFALGSLFPVVL